MLERNKIELSVYPEDLGELDLEETGKVLAVAGATVTHLLAERANVDITPENDKKIIRRVLRDFNKGDDADKARMVGALLLNIKINYGLIHPNLNPDYLKCDPDDYQERHKDVINKIANLNLTTDTSVIDQAASWVVFGKFASVPRKKL